MKVFIIAALTTDGFIGRSAGHTADWTGKADKKVFVELTKQAGVVVMGSRTFATINRALPGRRVIVYTSKPDSIQMEGVETTSETPADLLSRLEKDGCTAVAIGGGGSIYGQFMAAGLVSELYITVVPKLFGQGLPLFDADLDVNLSLIDSKPLDDGAVLLHYRVQA